MAEQSKLHIIPGKQLHANGPNYEFCEVAPIYGTSKANAVADFYNPTGIDHCSPEQFAQIEKDKEKIIKEMGAREVFLNPSRHWTWDEFWVYEVGDERQFGPVKMVYMGVVPVAVMKKAVGMGHYHPGQINRSNKYLYKNRDYGLSARHARRKGPGHAVLDATTSTRARRQTTSRTWAASSSSCRRAGSSGRRCSTAT